MHCMDQRCRFRRKSAGVYSSYGSNMHTGPTCVNNYYPRRSWFGPRSNNYRSATNHYHNNYSSVNSNYDSSPGSNSDSSPPGGSGGSSYGGGSTRGGDASGSW